MINLFMVDHDITNADQEQIKIIPLIFLHFQGIYHVLVSLCEIFSRCVINSHASSVFLYILLPLEKKIFKFFKGRLY
jgi:hypothetical protein